MKLVGVGFGVVLGLLLINQFGVLLTVCAMAALSFISEVIKDG